MRKIQKKEIDINGVSVENNLRTKEEKKGKKGQVQGNQEMGKKMMQKERNSMRGRKQGGKR